MRHDFWLPLTALAESLGAFVLVYVLLTWFGVSSLNAAVAGGVAIATSPAVLMAVVRDEKAEGPLTDRVLAIAAFDNVIAVLVVTILIGVLHMQRDITWITAITHPLYLVIGSVLAGAIAYFIASRIARLLGKRDELQFALLIVLLLMVAEVTRIFQLSVLIAALTFGVSARNLDHGGRLYLLDLGHGFTLVLVVLFVSAGGAITPKSILAAGGLALVLIAARAVGKALPAFFLAPLSGLSVRKSVMLGAALTPMSAVAIALVESVSRAHPEFGESGAAVLLAAVALLELIGPLVTQAALRFAGEAEPAAARR
jgi:Kef-type K+ transport system membrane component KefB